MRATTRISSSRQRMHAPLLWAILLHGSCLCSGFLFIENAHMVLSHNNNRRIRLSEEIDHHLDGKESSRGRIPWMIRRYHVTGPLRAFNDDDAISGNEPKEQESDPVDPGLRQSIPDLAAFRRQVQKNDVGYKSPTAFESLVPPDTTPKRQPTPEELLSIFEKLDNSTNPVENVSDSPHYSTKQEAEEDSDALFLDADLYTKSAELMDVDGSLNLPLEILGDKTTASFANLLTQPIMSPPSSLYPKQSKYNHREPTDNNPGLEEVLAAFQNAKSQPFNATQAEELHKQVFENEQGFLQQSRLFQESLTDPAAADQAASQRRSSQFLDRQSKAIKQLEEQMQAFENELMQRERPGPRQCDRCNCRLSEDDLDIRPQLWMQQQNLTTLCRTCFQAMIRTTSSPRKRRPPTASSPTMASGRRQYNSSPQPRSVRTAQPATGDFQRRTKVVAQSPRSGSQDSLGKSASPTSKPATDDSFSSGRNTSDSWTEIVDPDTGEVFYWNLETEEMKWELD